MINIACQVGTLIIYTTDTKISCDGFKAINPISATELAAYQEWVKLVSKQKAMP